MWDVFVSKNLLHLHHDFREWFTWSLIGVHTKEWWKKGAGDRIKENEKKFLENWKKGLPLPNFRQKRLVVSEQKETK